MAAQTSSMYAEFVADCPSTFNIHTNVWWLHEMLYLRRCTIEQGQRDDGLPRVLISETGPIWKSHCGLSQSDFD